MADGIDCDLLFNSSLAKELDRGECDALASILGIRKVSGGEVLVGEGDDDPTLFMLVDGGIEVISELHGEQSVVYRMQPGDVAGTRAFVDRSSRQATLRASGDATVYTLEPERFEALLDSRPRIVYKVMRGIFCITHTNLMRMNTESRELSDYVYRGSGRRF
jgi:CRP-like cAMP-binding protein